MTYTIKAGDTLSKIAARNGLTLAQLMQANPRISDPNKIKVGDVINLPNNSGPNDITRPLPSNPVEPMVVSTENTRPLPSNPVPAVSAGALGEALAEALGTLSAK
ncbi:MAG TPA: LysM domain-containing protein, partial [Pyrinomonadaceae bacterium]|nr:LysM domain-containing protein [Pyrinomonadaceae bacterium]